MNDLISRQAAIDALDAVCDRVCQYTKKQRSVMCGACPLGSAFDAIEDLPSAQPEQRWIPVSEKLPEDLQQVLVWYEYWHWNAEELRPEYGIGWRFRGLWCGDPGNGSRLRVIAWMPLPEPPKEEQDG